MKTDCKEVKNSAHCDFGRNGGLEDSTLGRAMSMPQSSWFYWTPWATPQEPQPVAADYAPASQPTPDPPLPTPMSEQQATWENWDEMDAAKKQMVIDDLKKKRDNLLEVQAGTHGKRQKAWPPEMNLRPKEKDDDKTYHWVGEETQAWVSSKEKENKGGWNGAWCGEKEAVAEERPKKVAKGDGRGSSDEPYDPNVYAYAKPNSCMLPSGMGQKAEDDWYKSSVHAVP